MTGGGHNHPGAPQEGTLLPSQPPSPIRASICCLKGKGGGGEVPDRGSDPHGPWNSPTVLGTRDPEGYSRRRGACR